MKLITGLIAAMMAGMAYAQPKTHHVRAQDGIRNLKTPYAKGSNAKTKRAARIRRARKGH